MNEQPNIAEVHQIGVVADKVGLSLRTIRHYDEVGLVTPSGRSPGGFRLYTDDDVARLLHIKAMKPLGFTLEESGELLAIRDTLVGGKVLSSSLLDLLEASATRAEERCRKLERQLTEARALTSDMWDQLAMGRSRLHSAVTPGRPEDSPPGH